MFSLNFFSKSVRYLIISCGTDKVTRSRSAVNFIPEILPTTDRQTHCPSVRVNDAAVCFIVACSHFPFGLRKCKRQTSLCVLCYLHTAPHCVSSSLRLFVSSLNSKLLILYVFEFLMLFSTLIKSSPLSCN
jgi:hypothetical protein